MFCSKCGTKNDADDLYCYKCGSRLKAAERPAMNQAGEASAEKTVQRSQSAVSNTPLVSSPPPAGPKKSKKGLVIGIAAAVVVIVGVAFAVKFLLLPNLQPTGSAYASAAEDAGTEGEAESPDNGDNAEPEDTFSAGSLTSGIYERDFSTPEEAVGHFVAAVADNDFREAIAASAVNEAAVHYDAAAFAERLRTINLYMGAPSRYAFYQELNRGFFMGLITDQMKKFVYSFSDSEAAQAIAHGQIYQLNGYESEAAQFVMDVDPAMLEGLAILRIDLPKRELFDSELHQKNLVWTAAAYGADEVTERIVLYELDGTTYLGGFTLLRYGGNWKILGLNSAIAGTALGTTEQIIEDDYLALLD